MSTAIQLLTSQRGSIESKMIAAGLTKEQVVKETSFAIQIVNRSKQLSKCSPSSVASAVVNIANIGLTLNPAAKESYLIPRWNGFSREMEAVLEPSYIGLVKLVCNTGTITSIASNVVYENDTFDLELSNNSNPITHRPCLVKSKRGSMIGAYSLATLKEGDRQAEWMDIDEIHSIRDNSESYKAFIANKVKSCVWDSWHDEMCRKTVLKRLTKYLPKGSSDKLDNAIELANDDYQAESWQIFVATDLISTSLFDDEIRGKLEEQLFNISKPSVEAMIRELKRNQIPSAEFVKGGFFPSQKQIDAAVKAQVENPKA